MYFTYDVLMYLSNMIVLITLKKYILINIMEASNDTDASNVLILWIVLNSILVVYAIGLFVYGKWFRPKDLTIYVRRLFNFF